ncbi:MAG TPA: acyl-CoA dehydrogenase family protein, partial [Myxococcota bacterium]|nr:acyl-CoA dehydrogenase family protein [Myxococcota bacterium]
MDFRFSEEQEELRSIARSFLEEHSGPEAIRTAMATELGYLPETWKLVAKDLGWPCVHIPEAYGGLGLTHVDLMVLLEASGEALLCAPFFSTVALGVNALLELGTESQKEARLPALADGSATATLAFAERSGRWDARGIETTATREGDDFLLNGEKSWVVDGHSADLLIVVARTPGTTGEEGLSAFLVSSDVAGLERKALPTMDQTRRLAEVRLDGVRVPASDCLGEPEAAWPGLRRTLDLAAISLAAEQVGGAQRCLDMAVAYAKEREQFGRPIGSFQAIKHKCADVMVAVESARSAVTYATCIAVDGSDDLSVNASLAKAWCSEAYFQAAAE